MASKKMNRRQFIGEASCSAVGSMTFLSSFLNLGAINALASRPHLIDNPGDYKAMVCILLAGGADSHNGIVPTAASSYAQYAATRADLALDIQATNPPQLLPLDYNNNGETFAVHAGMPRVRDMFDAGELAFIANIGTLIEPIANAAEYSSGLKKIPLGLYSHSDQIMQWQTSVPQSRSAVGVAGKILTDQRNATIESLVAQTYSNVFEQTISSLSQQTLDNIEVFKVALQNVVPLTTAFSNTNLSNDLKKIAELISVKTFLGAQRQIFYVSYGGWDHHDNVLGNQDVMLPILSNAMAEFNDAMKEIGMHDKLITFTISDFARTLTSNGNGSGHAWGGNQLIMGGPITGKQIYGTYPSLALSNNSLNLSTRGRILPTTSVDEFYAELALWFGVSPNDLDYILPNLCNFYSSSCPATVPNPYMPIGMFN